MAYDLTAGAAFGDISPKTSQFLGGYPHVERYSTGIHDPLLASALYLSDGTTEAMFIANDIISLSKQFVADVRGRIEKATGVPGGNIMVTATHTHSGPLTRKSMNGGTDPAVPDPDPAYVAFIREVIVETATKAHAAAEPAELGLAEAHVEGVGTNRREPNGPADPQAPVLLVRSVQNGWNLALMACYSMHPTVLHEDSTLVSADFPGMARQYLQKNVVGEDCPVVYHTGPAGNQSPRHVTKANTFEEATRLGEILGRAFESAICRSAFTSDVKLGVACDFVELPKRALPSVADAEKKLATAAATLEDLRASNASKQEVRTAEVDWFGAEHTLALAKAEADGRAEAAFRSCMPAEIQVLGVGPWRFVGWPGEIFVEYALKLKAQFPDTYIFSLANGSLSGYLATPEAAAEGGYEASNSLQDPAGGQILVDRTVRLLSRLGE